MVRAHIDRKFSTTVPAAAARDVCLAFLQNRWSGEIFRRYFFHLASISNGSSAVILRRGTRQCPLSETGGAACAPSRFLERPMRAIVTHLLGQDLPTPRREGWLYSGRYWLE